MSSPEPRVYMRYFEMTETQKETIPNKLQPLGFCVKRLVMPLIFLVAKRLFYDVDGNPKRCTKCGCREFSVLVKESINGTAAEQDYVCKDCGATVGFWAYGYFDPKYRRYGAA